tara:strand:+ start:1482 stop:2384 length:903 start_codon:yes stop_codon:yes gene_type:complete
MSGLITGIASLAISAGTTASSFIQAGKQKRLQEGYEADADKALAEARRALQVNYAKQMSIKKEPYNQERLAMLSQGQQVIDAASDSDRGAASAAGQVLMGQQASQSDITNRQSDELINIENAILEEESRLRDVNVDLDMQEVQGAQQAAADARIAAADAKQAGIQGIGQTAQAGLAMVPLYSQSKTKTNNAILEAQGADSTYLQGYDPTTATGKQYRQMKRQNPSFDVNTNYQRALAGLSVNQPPPQGAPAVTNSLMSPNGQGYQGFGSGAMNYQNPFSLQTPFVGGLSINPITGRPWGQ